MVAHLACVEEAAGPRLLHHALELCVVPRVARVPDLQVVAALSRDRVHAAITNILFFFLSDFWFRPWPRHEQGGGAGWCIFAQQSVNYGNECSILNSTQVARIGTRTTDLVRGENFLWKI